MEISNDKYPLLLDTYNPTNNTPGNNGALRQNMDDSVQRSESAPIHGDYFTRIFGDVTDDRSSVKRFNNNISSSKSLNALDWPGTFFTSVVEDCTNDDAVLPDAHLTGTVKSWFTLFKAFVGIGTLFMPRGFFHAGVASGTVTAVICGVLSLYCMNLNLASTEILVARGHRIPTYSALGELAMGRPGRLMVDALVLGSYVGFSCVYALFTASNVKDFLKLVTDCKVDISVGYYLLMGLPLLLPLILVRRLKYYAIPSLIADFVILFSVVYIFADDAVKLHHDGEADDWKWLGSVSGTMMFFGTTVYAFEGVAMCMPVHEAMRYPDKFGGVMTSVMLLDLVLSVAFGVAGYVVYGSHTASIILENVGSGVGGKLLRGMYAIVAITSFPLFMYPAATTVERMCGLKRFRSGSKWRKNAIRLALLLLVSSVAALCSQFLDALVAIVGGLCGVPLMVIFPPLFHLHIAKEELSKGRRMWMVVLFGIGCVCCVLSTSMAVYSMFNPDDDPIKNPDNCPVD